ncbi:MAG: hypothetical protein KHZ73_00535 [Lachnospiraceae bacterium]|nr:hypothetical protein [Lachnospiraceae bacterium]
MILKFKDGTQYNTASGTLPGSVCMTLNSYEELQGLEDAINTPGNLDEVTIGETTCRNLAQMEEAYFSVGKSKGKVQAIFALRQKTEEEIALETAQKEMQEKQDSIDTALTYLTDQQALTVKSLHKHWNDDPDGYHYSMDNPEDRRRQHNDGLWKLQKDHDKQASWFPGSDPTLWVQIVEGHAGTLEDPIPVPDSVTTSGFEYVYGKYYSEAEEIYLCQRQGIEDPESMYGQTEKLYAAPSALVGQYFIVAE